MNAAMANVAKVEDAHESKFSNSRLDQSRLPAF